ncbi:2-oxoglutarate dehydrogenase E2 component (dihydrolipoamide succinyltransferase) [Mucilaginibacter yixingensis]|uniref:Dihydrolipoamide acetyltransferase component of pyruvate dehydrogenase complex n=1 Tax=Mucilaginibacter yixingensis TaxID=1295612 RepID=A0A2T5J9R3_9SPHI|nr:dihydrolipoamide acetyltransferase family protein [Mucilaginibacter yixingensis]PTQ96813.1 2-oxoglutarate dehydrogenase E2 component (dihydrolipoamide succinyltransferase) [Mucilaginibacter yixingensis]
MAKYQLLLPKMGESVAEATIIRWLKNPGDHVEADEAVMEIATDKVDSEVPSPVSGRLAERLFNENDVVQVGAVVATIDTEERADTNAYKNDYVSFEEQPAAKPVAVPAPEPVNQSEAFDQQLAEVPVNEQAIPGINQLNSQPVVHAVSGNGNGRFYSPLVKNIAQHEGVTAAELDQIQGSGAEGRLTKEDLLKYLSVRGSRPALHTEAAPQQSATPVAERPEPVAAQQPTPQPAKPAYSVSGNDEIIEMDRMRRLIADHMVMSVQTSPHVTSFVEADVTNLVKWRDKVKSSFEKREGEKITFTPIFIEAVVKAIKDYPMVNVSVNGTQIIKKRDINIGMATALPSGNLIVPVIHKADGLNLTGMAKTVNDLAARARANKLQPDEIKNGTFTITNVGSFGNVMGTPIINQPQVAILAVGAIKKKPAVIETLEGDMIAIRHMMFLSLSYDHRVVDGALGGSFVRRVADYLENWDINTEI